MRSLGRVVAVVTCVAALGVAQAVTVAAPAGAGDIPEDEVDVPTVEGVTIIATYRYEGMKFFESGFILKQPQLDNFVSIDCGANGAVNPVGGPDGAPECGFHPPVTEATVTITGKKPWFDVEKSFDLIPYASFDDETYEKSAPVTIKAPKSGKVTTQEQAGERYLKISDAVNQKVTTTVEKVKSWDEETTGKQAVADVEGLVQEFDHAKAKLKKLQKKYPPAKQEIDEQRKAINAVQADLAAVGAINEGLDLANWKEKFDDHLKDLSNASDAVRGKLGLILIFEDSDPTPSD
jgi:hypothetical protein